jgi:hypothetical protein
VVVKVPRTEIDHDCVAGLRFYNIFGGHELLIAMWQTQKFLYELWSSQEDIEENLVGANGLPLFLSATAGSWCSADVEAYCG